MSESQKITDENKRALDVLDALLGQPLFSGSPGAEIVQKSLQCVLNGGGNLEFLRAISDLTVLKEIGARATKKSISIDVPLENESAIYFRNTSLKALCSIVASLSSPNKIDRGISESFASVPTLFSSICIALEKESDRTYSPA